MQREIAAIEAADDVRKQVSTMIESAAVRASADYSTAIDRTQALYDVDGWYSGARATNLQSDMHHGDNSPHWRTEFECNEIRGICRVLSQVSEAAIGVKDTRRNYVVGSGFEIRVTPRPAYAKDQHAEELAKLCGDWLERQLDANRWNGEYEFEAFDSLLVDGEQFWLIEPDAYDDDVVRFRLELPENVVQPGQPEHIASGVGMESGLDWKYGIAAPQDESWRPLAYHVLPYQAVEASVYGPHQVEHIKQNVRSNVKRGVSDFYPVWQTLRRMEKLLGNTLEGAAVQASIAFVREHAEKTSNAEIANFVSLQADSSTTTTTQNGSRQLRERETVGVNVHDVGAGVKYHAGPLGGGSVTPIYIEAISQAMRVMGVRWQMPEYMISGDASNGNYASTLVAESPFVKSCQSQQYRMTRGYERMLMRVLRTGAGMGLLPVSANEIAKYLRVAVDAQEPTARDEKEQHELHKSQNAAGMLSLDSWATAEGIDLAEERAKGAAAVQQMLPGMENQPSQQTMIPVSESWAMYP